MLLLFVRGVDTDETHCLLNRVSIICQLPASARSDDGSLLLVVLHLLCDGGVVLQLLLQCATGVEKRGAVATVGPADCLNGNEHVLLLA